MTEHQLESSLVSRAGGDLHIDIGHPPPPVVAYRSAVSEHLFFVQEIYLQKSHVHPIYIRPFLSVDLDIDKVIVHDLCNFIVLERLVG
jgi:hypothetical protein